MHARYQIYFTRTHIFFDFLIYTLRSPSLAIVVYDRLESIRGLLPVLMWVKW